jgi:hypothetical protein
MVPIADPANLTVEEADALLRERGIPDQVREQLVSEVAATRAISESMEAIARRIAAGEKVSWEDIQTLVAEVSGQHGLDSGVPIPWDEELRNRMVFASQTPLQWAGYREQAQTEIEEEIRCQVQVRNSWDVPGDYSAVILEMEGKPVLLKEYHAGRRLKKLWSGFEMRNRAHITADAEIKAIESLRERITPTQFNGYMVSGMFAERSKRSDLHYLFRKGFPTIAMSFHGDDDCRVLCALCFHPFGYADRRGDRGAADDAGRRARVLEALGPVERC